MPLPAVSERAARRVARLCADFDAALMEHVATGAPIPPVSALLDEIRALIIESLLAAFSQIDPAFGWEDIAGPVTDQYTPIERAIRASERRARRDRRRVERGGRIPDRDDDESAAGFARRVGVLAAFVALVAALPERRRTKPEIRRTARRVGARLPTPTAAYSKMVVRTETAVARNKHAAGVALRDSKVILVVDARKGPTDRACEDVSNRYATPTWIRRHPVEHPNCTRLGRPVDLPPGQHVTLLE